MRLSPFLLLGPLILVTACVEYGLGTGKDEPESAEPDIVVSPEEVAVSICESLYDDVVVATNEGDGPLTLLSATTTGDWTTTVGLPVTLDSGESLSIDVSGTGEGELTITSDDPDEPTVVVPLTAVIDTPPVATLTSPLDGSIFGEPAGDQTLTGSIVDPDSGSIDITWRIDGAVLGTDTVAPGAVSTIWPAPASGDHTITLQAADTCSAASSAISVCQDGTTTTENLGISTWHYEGSAYWDGPNNYLVLTDALQTQVGSAFDTTAAVTGSAVDIDFDFYIGDGTGADGISLTALDTTRMAATYLGGSGCGIGYGGNADCTTGPALPGWSVEVDTYYNGGYDPTDADHVAFTFDGDADGPAAWAALPEVEGTGWHTMNVRVADPHVTVTIDGVTYIDQDLTGSFGFPAYVGFTAGTGSVTNRHLIRALTVTDRACD